MNAKKTERYEIAKATLLEYLILFKGLNNGDSPTYREMCAYIYGETGLFVSSSNIRRLLQQLQDDGKIFVHNRSKRTLSILVYGYEWRKVNDGGPDPLCDLRVP